MQMIFQRLESKIEVRASGAFAAVQMTFPDDKNQQVQVQLDMESWIKVMEPMDQGHVAVEAVKAQQPVWAQSPDPRILFAGACLSVFFLGLGIGSFL